MSAIRFLLTSLNVRCSRQWYCSLQCQGDSMSYSRQVFTKHIVCGDTKFRDIDWDNCTTNHDENGLHEMGRMK